MTIKLYTNVKFLHGNLFVRGFDESGKRVTERVDFHPTVWVRNNVNYSKFRKNIIASELNKFTLLTNKNEKLSSLTFDSIKSCSDFIKSVASKIITPEGLSSITLNGVYTAPSQIFESQYMCEQFPAEIKFDVSKLKIYNYDIETEVGHRDVPNDTIVLIRNKEDNVEKSVPISYFETIPHRDAWELFDESDKTWKNYEQHPFRWIGGFPEPLVAGEKITLITVKDVNFSQIYTWGYYDFENKRSDVNYFKCKDEVDLLNQFLSWWENNYPDIISGWNTSKFDNPYITNRIIKVLGQENAKRLSPFNSIKFEIKKNDLKQDEATATWNGIADIDYLKLYKKFGVSSLLESYKLDFVAEKEIGIKKVENPTGGSFKDFYSGEFDVFQKPSKDAHEIRKLGYLRTQLKKEIDFNTVAKEKYDKLNELIIQKCKQTFIEYNIRDVELVDKIDKVRRLIDLCVTMAYQAHANFEAAFSPVKSWDYIIYNVLWRRNVIIPEKVTKEKSEKFEGAYVKPPLIGKHKYCASFDYDSLYPHLMMQYNISPETMIYREMNFPLHYDLNVDKLVNKTEDTSVAKKYNFSLAASGYCFSNEKQGIIPELCETYYAKRKTTKKIYLKYKAEHEKILLELRNRGLRQ